MEFLSTIKDIITEYGSYILGFFTDAIESVGAQVSAGNILIAVLFILIVYMKIKKIL